MLSLGSNFDSERNIFDASDRLVEALGAGLSFGEARFSAAVGLPGSPDFLNRLVEGETNLDMVSLMAILKRIEREMGRTPEDKSAGKIVIDIDILVWNGEVVNKRTYEAEFVQALQKR